MKKSSRPGVIWLLLAVLGFAVAGFWLPAGSSSPAVQAGILAGPGQAAQPPMQLCEGPAWTLMVYLAGDNDLEVHMKSTLNRLELGANNPAVDIVAMLDTTKPNDSYYYKVKYDENLEELASYTDDVDRFRPVGGPEVNTSKAEDLAEFIKWTREHYPNQHYALIIKDHGLGLSGLAKDTSGLRQRSWLTVKAWSEALALGLEEGQKLDVLFADVCLMAMVEDAYQIRKYVQYYVASENYIWVVSEPYDKYASKIGPSSTAEEVANIFVNEHAAFMEGYLNDGVCYAYTVSAMDLASMDSFVQAINALAKSLRLQMDEVKTFGKQVVKAARDAAQHFDDNFTGSLNTTDSHIDLYDFAGEILQRVDDEEIKYQAGQVRLWIRNVIVAANEKSDGDAWGYDMKNHQYKKINLSRSEGMSIFFPPNRTSYYNGKSLEFAKDTQWEKLGPLTAVGTQAQSVEVMEWGQMLVHYFELVEPGTQDTPEAPEPVSPSLPAGSSESGGIAGHVLLPGRSDHSGTRVTCGSYSTTTAADGSFWLELPDGSYTCTADHALCLTAQRSGVSATTGLPEVTLAAGDANSDGRIDLFDLVIISTAYGSAPPSDARADMNADSVINLYDLVLSSTNYGRTGPTPW